MDTYRTEEEQIAAIKQFWNEHGRKLIAVLLAAIVLFFAVQNWNKTQKQGKEQVSLYYNELSQAATAGMDMTAEDKAKFDSAYGKILEDYPKTVYATYAAFFKAKHDVDANNLDEAEKTLQWAVDAKFDTDMQALATLRLARVKAANNKADEALVLLAKNPGPFAGAFEEAKGDIYMSQDNAEQALMAYKKAQSLKSSAGNITGQLLTMKIQSLDAEHGNKLFPKAGAEVAAEK